MAGRKTIWKWVLNMVWMLTGVATIVLLVAAIRKKDSKACKAVNVHIYDRRDNFFVDEKDVLATITTLAGGNPAGRPTGQFNLRAMETALEKNVWISDAQLFFDNNDVLQVNIMEREPIARVFNMSGESFYIDSSTASLPLSDKFSARLPVFTNFPGNTKVLSAADSALLREVISLARLIAADPFCMAMIEQTDITAGRSFEMIPKIGRSIIVFGDGKNAEAKLDKLKLFYQQVVAKAGWNYYSTISLRYEGQVVAARRGMADMVSDSLATRRLLDTIAARMERLAEDSVQRFVPDNAANTTDSSLVLQSIQREDADVPATSATRQDVSAISTPAVPQVNAAPPAAAIPPHTAVPAQRPPTNPQPPPQHIQRPATPPARPPANTSGPKPKPAVRPKPRAVMPPKNDY